MEKQRLMVIDRDWWCCGRFIDIWKSEIGNRKLEFGIWNLMLDICHFSGYLNIKFL